MPSSPSRSMGSLECAMPRTEGPAMMPTAMKLTISGWRSRRPRKPAAAASTRRAATSLKIEPVIHSASIQLHPPRPGPPRVFAMHSMPAAHCPDDG